MMRLGPESAALRPGWERVLMGARVVLTAALLVALFLAFGLTPARLARTFGDASWPHLVLAFAVLAVLMLLLSMKWYFIARALNVATSFPSVTRMYLVGTVLSNVLPTAIGGDLYRVVALSREGGTGVGGSLVTVVIERATGYAGLLLLAGVAAGFYFAGVVAGVAAALLLAVLAGAAHLALRRVRRDEFDEAESGSWRWWRSPATGLTVQRVAVLSIVQQGMWITVAAILGLAYDVSVPWTYWAVTVTAMTLLTALPLSVGGLGIREIGYVSLLGPVGVDAGKAAAISLAMGFGPSLVSLVIVVPFLFLRTPPEQPATATAVRGERAGADRTG